MLRFDGETFITKEFNQQETGIHLKAGDVILVQTGHMRQLTMVPPEHEGHNCSTMIVISPWKWYSTATTSRSFSAHQATQRAFAAIEKGMTLRHLNCHDVIHFAHAHSAA